MNKLPQPHTLSCYGSQVKYWTFHKGKPITIVMLHGFRGTHHGLQKIIDALPGFTIIVPDLPGFGGSTAMTERRHDIAGYSDFAQAFMEKLGLKQPVLLGHSFGSIIAAHLAANKPKLISKLIFVNPVAVVNAHKSDILLALGRFYYLLASRILPERWGTELLRNRQLILLGSIFMTKTKNKKLRKQIHQSHLNHFGDFHDRTSLQQAYEASLKHAIADYARRITMPTLLIAGQADAITPPDGQHKVVTMLPNAQLVMIPSVGHLIHHEKAVRAAKAIQKFLAKA